MTELKLTKRNFLAGISLVSSAAFLSACSNSDEAADAGDPGIDTEIKTASVDTPSPRASISVDALMAENALPEAFIGEENAPVTIVEYSSLTCPHCANFHAGTLPAIKEKYIETGKVRYIMREFPLDALATAGVMLARCAPDDKYFPFVEMLFSQQRSWALADDKRAALLQMSKLAGFTQESFEACLTNQKLLDDVVAVKERAAKDFGVSGTPAFFINGDLYSGELSVDELSAIIESKL